MLTNPKFKELNSYKRVHCMAGADLFARIGKRSTTPLPSSEDVIPMNQRKLDMIEDMQSYDRQMEIEYAKMIQEEYLRKLKEDKEREIAKLQSENNS